MTAVGPRSGIETALTLGRRARQGRKALIALAAAARGGRPVGEGRDQVHRTAPARGHGPKVPVRGVTADAVVRAGRLPSAEIVVDARGGHQDPTQPRSTRTYLETNPVIIVLAEIAVALALRDREARARLTVVRPDAE